MVVKWRQTFQVDMFFFSSDLIYNSVPQKHLFAIMIDDVIGLNFFYFYFNFPGTKETPISQDNLASQLDLIPLNLLIAS